VGFEQVRVIGHVGRPEHREAAQVQERMEHLEHPAAARGVKVNEDIAAEHDIGLIDGRRPAQQIELLKADQPSDVRVDLPARRAFDGGATPSGPFKEAPAMMGQVAERPQAELVINGGLGGAQGLPGQVGAASSAVTSASTASMARE